MVIVIVIRTITRNGFKKWVVIIIYQARMINYQISIHKHIILKKRVDGTSVIVVMIVIVKCL